MSDGDVRGAAGDGADAPFWEQPSPDPVEGAGEPGESFRWADIDGGVPVPETVTPTPTETTLPPPEVENPDVPIGAPTAEPAPNLPEAEGATGDAAAAPAEAGQTATSLTPRLTGQPIDAAAEETIQAGFVPEMAPLDRAKLAESGVNLSTKPENVVLAQTPAPATPIPAGCTITLRYLEPQARTEKNLPPGGIVAEKKMKVGKNGIIAAGLATAAVVMVAASIFGSVTPSGDSAATSNPSPSATYEPTRPPANLTVAIPDVVGDSPERAEKTLTNAGFTVGQELEQVSNENPNKIAAQSPAAGMPSQKGSTVNLVVGVSAKGVPIPSVLEQPEQQAADTIKAAGLTVIPSQTIDSDQPAGTVVQQMPSAGQLAPENGKVLLLLSNGKKKMPNVVGSQEQQAASDLVALGLKVKVYSLKNTRQPAGTVVGQSPAEGGFVKPGGEVSITVSADEPSTRSETPPATAPSPEPGQPSAEIIPNPGTE